MAALFHRGIAPALLACTVGAAWAQAPSKQIRSSKDGAELVLLEAGTFTIGTNQKDLRDLLAQRLKVSYAGLFQGELPPQQVTLTALYIDKTEVTNRQYAGYVARGGGKPSRYKDYPQFNRPTQPVTGIGWKDAAAYCRWVGRRLPTELEWERAARGPDGRTWPWGNEPEAGRFNGRGLGRYGATAVGSFPAGNTREGVSDMAGNVWELTASDWGNSGHVMKGGSFLNDLAYSRAAVRWASSKEDDGAEYLGFRCIVELERAGETTR
jgi:formylglycine-generating enzyme required for sulfatase activity